MYRVLLLITAKRYLARDCCQSGVPIRSLARVLVVIQPGTAGLTPPGRVYGPAALVCSRRSFASCRHVEQPCPPAPSIWTSMVRGESWLRSWGNLQNVWAMAAAGVTSLRDTWVHP